MAMMIDVSSLSTWAPYEGIGAGDLFTADGVFSFTIKSATTKIVGDAKREALLLSLICLDEDNKGRQINHNCIIGGVDNKGNPMVRNLGELFFSLGKSQDEVKAYASQGQLDLEQIAKAITGKTCYGRVSAEEFNNKGKVQRNSKIDSLIGKAAYTDAVALGGHRKPHGFTAATSSAPAQITPAASTPVSTPAALPAINF